MTRPAARPPTNDQGVPVAPGPPPRWRHALWLVAALLLVVLFIVLPATEGRGQTTLTYTQFMGDVTGHKVKTVTIETDGNAAGTLTDGADYVTVIPPQAGETFLHQLQEGKVAVTAESSASSTGSSILTWFLLLVPFLLIGYFWWRLSRRGGMGLQGAMGVGRSKARVFDEERPKTTFTDVAGYEGAKQEIREVVDFLQRPGRYERAGAMAPRGILMVGPPGTGKTLLARAVAGEAAVPFFSVTGSSFVEMFVGVGAARVRDLFEEARKRAPAIIFLDEVDAIGQRRGGMSAMVSNDEREQTLNQLLAEMDGFDPSAGIVVLAATNRPEVLDPALLRPGRFDRTVVIPLPTQPERRSILEVHCRDKRLDGTVDLDVVARGTPGFSGADLANLANEAAIHAVRSGRELLGAQDFDEARDRIILGRREGSNVLIPSEKHAVAVHEAGHALVAAYADKADPIAKVTILPAGQALGATEQLPLVERHLFGEDTLAGHVGGPARRSVQRARRTRPGVDRRVQRPGQGDGPGHEDGAGVRTVGGAGPGGLSARWLGLPRGGWRRVHEPSVRRADPGRHRRGGGEAPARGGAPGDGDPDRPPTGARRADRAPPRRGDRRRVGRLPAGRSSRSRSPGRHGPWPRNEPTPGDRFRPAEPREGTGTRHVPPRELTRSGMTGRACGSGGQHGGRSVRTIPRALAATVRVCP